jgi:hypothetical protein
MCHLDAPTYVSASAAIRISSPKLPHDVRIVGSSGRANSTSLDGSLFGIGFAPKSQGRDPSSLFSPASAATCVDPSSEPNNGRSIMSSPATSHELIEEIRREHQALGVKLGHIRRICAGEIRPGEEMAALLLDLYDALKSHFRNEEFHGFFGEVTARAPELNPEANKLCAEHRDMLQTVSELARFAAVGAGSREWWREVNTRFLVLADQLRRHEHDEDSLLQRAYQEDLGVND